APAIDYLSVTLSHPRWLVERWYDRLGFERTETWLQFNNRAAPLTLRVNPLKTTAEQCVSRLESEGIQVPQAQYAPDGWIVDAGNPLHAAAFDAGWFVVQDEASQLVARLAGAYPGTRVLDTCAAPGGKTTAIAAAMEGRGLLIACDVRAKRVALL